MFLYLGDGFSMLKGRVSISEETVYDIARDN